MIKGISTVNKCQLNNLNNNHNISVPFLNKTACEKNEQIPKDTGISALAASIVGGMSAAGKFTKANKTPCNIHFIQAKTLKEAVEFGQKNLGIKKYKGFSQKDVDIINWVNEALVNVYNKTKGTAHMPKKIIYSDTKKLALAMAGISRSENLYLSKRLYEPLKQKYKIIEKSISTEINQNANDTNLFKRAIEYILKDEKYSFTVSPFNVIYHEIGHLQHQKNIDGYLFDCLDSSEQRPKQLTTDAKKLIKLFNNSKGVQAKISPYAQTSPMEFVAECYSKMCSGMNLDDDEKELYKKLGGVPIN